ncbi:MAG: hypothetical protein HXY26_10965 [Hydrogenophilaceae bacterium]|nr:hypothetical protein [Hydrogenophilaceae bacterium]
MAKNGFWKSLFSSLQRVAPNPELDAAVERVVDAIDPKLKLAGGYPQRYRQAVAHALAYTRDLARQVPGPVTINREAYTKDPFIRAIFASPDEFQAALCMSRAMQDYLKGHTCTIGSQLYAMVGMRRREKGVIGMEVIGDSVRHDVAQTAVCFSDHTLTNIANSEAGTRDQLAWSFMDSLLGQVSDRIEQLKQAKQDLDQKRGELMARLRSADPEQQAHLQAELDRTLAELREATEKLDLRRYADYLDAVLLQPEAHLRLEAATLYLDDMGIKRNNGNGREIHFVDMIGRDRRRWSIALLHCQSPGVVSMTDRLQEASRWMDI